MTKSINIEKIKDLQKKLDKKCKDTILEGNFIYNFDKELLRAKNLGLLPKSILLKYTDMNKINTL
jgi:hypothetical protein